MTTAYDSPTWWEWISYYSGIWNAAARRYRLKIFHPGLWRFLEEEEEKKEKEGNYWT